MLEVYEIPAVQGKTGCLLFRGPHGRDGRRGLQDSVHGSLHPAPESKHESLGEAVTIYQEAVTEVPAKPFQLEMELIDDLEPGQIVVAQCNAENLSAFWGGLLSNAAVGRGGLGGCDRRGARDYNEITELGFPVFCRGLIPYDSQGRMDGKERNIPVVCGGIRVCPGDLVYADVDGVIVVPGKIAPEVIEKAWQKVQGENTVREELRAGAGIVKTFEKYGIL